MTVKDEIIELLKSTRRENVGRIINFLEESDFFTAPSSKDHHGNYEGALAEHSLNVMKLFYKKNNEFHLGLTETNIIICGLLHDVCKVNFYIKEIKSRKKEDGQWEKYEGYGIKDDYPMGHGEKSVMVIQEFMPLTRVEAMIIRWHMGGFVSKDDLKNYNNATKMTPAIVAFHTSDYESSTFLEKTVEV